MLKITSKDFVSEALKTEPKDLTQIKKRLENDSLIRLLHASLGMETEAGEFTDVVKKHIFYGKELDLVNLEEELGDLLWYIAIAIDTLGLSLNEIMTKNIEKLRKRYPEKFTEESALNRDVDNEMTHFRVQTD